MVDGLNFKDFVAFLSAFSAKASLEHKVARNLLSFFICLCTLLQMLIEYCASLVSVIL